MKILILCSNYEPGGAQRAALRLNESFNNKGFKCETWFLNRKAPDFSLPEPNLIYCKRVSITSFLPLWLSLFKLIKKNKPDFVLTMLPYANIIGLFTAWLCGVKNRIASHRAVCELELSGIKKQIDTFFANNGLYTQITAVSVSTKESFSHYSKKAYSRITVINNGLRFKPSELSKECCRNKFGIEKSKFIIGTIGRLVEVKNHLFLVQLLKFLPDLKLVIAGKGTLEKKIKEKAEKLDVSDQLLIIPEIMAEDIPCYLKCLDIFIMPSIFEGLSNALLEAMFAGLPIVSSDISAQRDVLFRESDGLKAGILLPLDQPDKWIETIKYLKQKPSICAQLSKNALLRSKDFTITKMTNGYINIFEQINS